MAKFIVQIAETNNYEIPVDAESEDEARRLAIDEWLSAATVGQWEIADMETEVVAVTCTTNAEGK